MSDGLHHSLIDTMSSKRANILYSLMKLLTQTIEEQLKKNVPIYAGIGFEILEYIYYGYVYFLLISWMCHFSPFYTSFIAYTIHSDTYICNLQFKTPQPPPLHQIGRFSKTI